MPLNPSDQQRQPGQHESRREQSKEQHELNHIHGVQRVTSESANPNLRSICFIALAMFPKVHQSQRPAALVPILRWAIMTLSPSLLSNWSRVLRNRRGLLSRKD